MVENALTYQQAQEFVHQNGVHGSRRDLERIIDVFGREPNVLELVATALRDLKGGDAGEPETPDVFVCLWL